jgi:predicted permease
VKRSVAFLRPLVGAPWLSFAVATTFAIGVGVATALFAYLSFFLFPTLDAPEPERVAQVDVVTEKEPSSFVSVDELRALTASGSFDLLAGTAPAGATVTFERRGLHSWGRAIGADFFPLFGARAALGRLFVAADDAPGAEPVAVLGHRLWRGLFASDPGVVGRSIELNGRSFTVVGVVEYGFQGVGFASEFFVPLRQSDRLLGLTRFETPEEKWLFAWGRLPADPVARVQATARARSALAGLDATTPLPDAAKRRLHLTYATEPGDWIRTDPYFTGARYLTAAAALFLLLAAGNVSGLLHARATARDREWAVRKAMGASPVRLAAAIAAEVAPAVVLGLLGAVAVARVVMSWIERALIATVGGLGTTWAVEDARALRYDGWLVAFAAGAAVVALAVAVGAPLLRVLRRPAIRALRDESAGGGTDRRRLAPRRLLVVGQLALAVALVVGGTLLVGTLRSLAKADPGFDSGGLVLATVHLPRSPAGNAADVATYLTLVERAAALPGVRAVTLAHVGPNTGFTREAKAAPVEKPGALADVSYNIVGPRYASTLGVPLLVGRELDERDAPGAAPAIVVSRALARKLFGDENVVGRRLRTDLPVRQGDLGPEFEIVGVVEDAGVTSPSEPARPWIFFAYGQRRHSRMALVLRTATPVGTLEPALRDLVSAVRHDASLIDLVSTEEQLGRALHAQRINATIAGGLSVAGLATALGGLAALQIFTVNLRRRELGVRAALGASSRELARSVLRDSLALAAAGAVVGLAAAAAASRLLQGLLFGVRPIEPVVFLAVPLLLAGAVVAASLPPARRAARVDPTESLRAS